MSTAIRFPGIPTFNATHAGDLGIKARVVVAEETNARTRAGDGLGEALGFALVTTPN